MEHGSAPPSVEASYGSPASDALMWIKLAAGTVERSNDILDCADPSASRTAVRLMCSR